MARTSLLSKCVYRLNTLGAVPAQLVVILVQAAVWSALYGDKASVQGITLPMMITYCILGTFQRSLDPSDVDVHLFSGISSGDICFDIMRPMSLRAYLISRELGTAVFRLVFLVGPSLLVVLGFLPFEFRGKGNCLAFTVSAMLGFAVIFELSFICGLATSWTKEGRLFGFLRRRFTEFLSGSIVPLCFYPAPVEKVLRYLPFQAIASAPISSYLGLVKGWDLAQVLVVQVFWLVILYSFGNILWRMSRERMVVQGG